MSARAFVIIDKALKASVLLVASFALAMLLTVGDQIDTKRSVAVTTGVAVEQVQLPHVVFWSDLLQNMLVAGVVWIAGAHLLSNGTYLKDLFEPIPPRGWGDIGEAVESLFEKYENRLKEHRR